MTTYRVGRHQAQNVYRGTQYIGVMFDPADAALVVDCLNDHTPPSSADPEATRAWVESRDWGGEVKP